MTDSDTFQNLSGLIAQVEHCWPIGHVTAAWRIKRGLVNETYRLSSADRKEYILRLYHPDIKSGRIRNEHELLHRLDLVAFSLAPRLIAPIEPPTWKPLKSSHDDPRYMALMTYLTGKDRYTWDGPPAHASAAKALGNALARYHQAIQGWWTGRADPAAGEARVLQRLAGNLTTEPLALSTLEALRPALQSGDRRAWPTLVVHGDFHAANVRWRGERITGLFDFEYADLNWRLYDVGMAGAYLATGWAPANEGVLQLKQLRAFLDGYESAFAIGCPLPPLLTGEKAALPRYLALAHLLTLEWAAAPGTQRRLGATSARRYARHARTALAWLGKNAPASSDHCILS